MATQVKKTQGQENKPIRYTKAQLKRAPELIGSWLTVEALLDDDKTYMLDEALHIVSRFKNRVIDR